MAEKHQVGHQPASRLLLRVQAAAEYHTHDRDLMANVRPVPVDLVLDPYFLNLLPYSLVPLVVAGGLLAPLLWWIAVSVCRYIVLVSQGTAHGGPVVSGSAGLCEAGDGEEKAAGRGDREVRSGQGLRNRKR
jgi:hypothetical protein